MIARKVAALLKPNSLREFTNLMECEVLPWLRQQEGFMDLITLVSRDGREVATISFWDLKGNGNAYHPNSYPEALKILEEILDGTPYVKTFNVVSSTFQMGVGAQPRAPENADRETGSLHLGWGLYGTSA